MQKGTVPTVSVVMPAYNAEKYLREAIDSILAQTFTDFELIIINDGSTDSTKDIILSYGDPRIVYLENEQNSGICVTLNRGLDAARGRYIARMDADDISLPQRLSLQVAYMDSHPEVGVAGTDIEVFGEGVTPYIFEQLHTPEECQAGLLFNSCFAHPSVIIRKSVLRENNLQYNDDFRGLEDYELWWQISKHSKLNNIPEPLLRYRHHKGQVTKNFDKKFFNSFVQFITERFNDLDIRISEYEVNLWLKYTLGQYDEFDEESLFDFIILAKIILKAAKISCYGFGENATKLTLGKGLVFTINKSPKLKGSPIRLYTKVYLNGLLPLSWYLKLIVIKFFRK